MADDTGWLVFLGVAIGIFSAVASNIGTNTQKFGFMSERKKKVHSRRAYQHQPLWWIGFILVVLGAVGDLFSFSLAPQSLVAPTGSFTLVSNVFFARVWLGEVLTTRDILGTILVIVGAVISVSFGSHEETAYSIEELQALYLQPAMAVYGIFMLLLWCGLATVIRRSEAILRQSMAGLAALEEASPFPSAHADDARGASPPPAARASDAPQLEAGDDSTTQLAAAAADAAILDADCLAPAPGSESDDGGGDGASSDGEERPALETRLAKAPTHRISASAPASSAAGRIALEEVVASETSGSVDKPTPAASRQAVELAQLTAGLREPPEEYAAYARWHPLAYAAMAGSIGGQTVMFAKSLGEIVKATASGSNQFVYFFTYVILVCMIACTVFEQHFLASSLQLFDALLVVPVFSSAFMIITVLGGAAYFGELASLNTLSWVLFPTGILLTVCGVLILSLRKQTGDGLGSPSEAEQASGDDFEEAGDEEAASLSGHGLGGIGLELVSLAEVEEEEEEEGEEEAVSPHVSAEPEAQTSGVEDDDDEERGDAVCDVLAAAASSAVPHAAGESPPEADGQGPAARQHRRERGATSPSIRSPHLVAQILSDEGREAGARSPASAATSGMPLEAVAGKTRAGSGGGLADVPGSAGAATTRRTRSATTSPSGTSPDTSPASSPRRALRHLASSTPPAAGVSAGPPAGSGGSRRGSLLRPEWRTVVASRPQGLAAFMPFAVRMPLPAAGEPAEVHPPPHRSPQRHRRPRAATDVPVSSGPAPALLHDGRPAAPALTPPGSAPAPPDAGAPTAHSRRRPSLLDSTVSLINAVTFSHTVVSAFGPGVQVAAGAGGIGTVARPRASSGRPARVAQIRRASSAQHATPEPPTDATLRRSRSDASPAVSPGDVADTE